MRAAAACRLQWSPVLETGNTRQGARHREENHAAMEPGLRDREYQGRHRRPVRVENAAMEPGLRDREYQYRSILSAVDEIAAMEPGLRDREYPRTPTTEASVSVLQWSPVLETGNTIAPWPQREVFAGCNGARS